MTPDNKKLLLRVAMGALLIGIWLFFFAQPEEPVWWFWLVPIPLVLTVYQVMLRGYRCGRCGQDFGLRRTGHTPGGALGGGRAHMICVACGHKQTQRTGPQ